MPVVGGSGYTVPGNGEGCSVARRLEEALAGFVETARPGRAGPGYVMSRRLADLSSSLSFGGELVSRRGLVAPVSLLTAGGSAGLNKPGGSGAAIGLSLGGWRAFAPAQGVLSLRSWSTLGVGSGGGSGSNSIVARPES
jgi:hypothetical protein